MLLFNYFFEVLVIISVSFAYFKGTTTGPSIWLTCAATELADGYIDQDDDENQWYFYS